MGDISKYLPQKPFGADDIPAALAERGGAVLDHPNGNKQNRQKKAVAILELIKGHYQVPKGFEDGFNVTHGVSMHNFPEYQTPEFPVHLDFEDLPQRILGTRRENDPDDLVDLDVRRAYFQERGKTLSAMDFILEDGVPSTQPPADGRIMFYTLKVAKEATYNDGPLTEVAEAAVRVLTSVGHSPQAAWEMVVSAVEAVEE